MPLKRFALSNSNMLQAVNLKHGMLIDLGKRTDCFEDERQRAPYRGTPKNVLIYMKPGDSILVPGDRLAFGLVADFSLPPALLQLFESYQP